MPKIMISNVNHTIEDDDLSDKFAAYGKVIEATVSKDRETGRHRGYGYVTYDTQDEADSAIKNMDGTTWLGLRLRVRLVEDK